MGWTLADIRNKVRQVTGRLSSNQISNAELDLYINNFYQFVFPAEVKLEREHQYYEFNTVPYQGDYTLPNGTYTNTETPIYVEYKPVLYYQDPVVFWSQNPRNYGRQTPWTGDGTTTAFNTTITLTASRITPGSVIVTDKTETFTDDGSGSLSGDAGGTGSINYASGVISVSFNTAPTDGQDIFLTFQQYTPGEPNSSLVYNNVITFFPVPDNVYPVQVKAWKVPTALDTDIDTPDLEEWGPAIAYGASRDIVADYGEIDRYSEITALYKEQISYVLTRTVQNLSNVRSRPFW